MSKTLFGIAISVLRAAYARWRANHSARRLAGLWTAYDVHEGCMDLTQMRGASVTVISARSVWSGDSHILDVYGRDFLDGKLREHDGRIVIDRDCPSRATRTVIYRDSDEITEQKIEITPSNRTLYIFPTEPGYGKHALRRSGQLGLC